ncbi:MAG: hypothetical protein JSU83_13545 [Deltaproteobacteria bacterium]|nr:MAG: hypothetical protein JSU83_13545 [Deltaproteobacteria bacterium]
MGYKKLALSFLAIAVAMVAVLVLSFLYLYYHPSTLKTVIEKSFSAKADLSLQIEDLGYSIRPLGVLAKNIVIKAAKNAYRFELKVPQLKADFSLAGPFGSRKLIIKELSLTEFSIDLEPGLKLPQLTEQKKSTSAFGRILKRLVGFFFFTDVMVESAQARNGRMHLQSADQQILVRQLNASLTADRLDISGSAAIHWLAPDSIVKFPEFSIAVDSGFYTGKSIIGGQILFPEGIFEGPNARVEGIQGGLRWVYKPALKKIEIESATVEGKSLIIAGKMETATVFNNLLFTTGGIHDLHQNQLRLTDWRLTTENLFELNGNAEVNIQPPYSLKIGFTHGRLASQRLLPIFKDVVDLNSIPLTLSGDIGLEGTIEVTQTRPEWAFHTDITAKLAQNQVSISSDRIRLNGIFSGHIRAVGRMPSPDLSAAFNGENIILASGDTKLRSIAVNVSMNGSYPAFSIPDLKARIPRMGSKDHSLDNIEVHLKNGLVNVKTGSLSWPEIRLSSSVLKNLRLSASGQSEQLLINLKAEDSHLLEAAATFGFLPEDWTFGGRDSIQATAVIRQNGWSTISSKLAITGLNFYNPDESCLAENIRASLETSTMFHMEDRKIKGTFSFETPNGEFLCDKIYLDLAQNGFSATADGIYDGQSRSLQISRIKLGLQDLVALDIHGNLYSRNNTPEFDFFIALPKTAISPLFYHLIAEPFKHERPALAELKIDGLISAGLNVVKRGADWTVKGKANWHTGNLNVGKTGVFFKGIDMNLPVWFQTEKPQSGSETMRGRLLIQKMALPFLPEQPLTIPLKVRPDSIATAAATRLFLNPETFCWTRLL